MLARLQPLEEARVREPLHAVRLAPSPGFAIRPRRAVPAALLCAGDVAPRGQRALGPEVHAVLARAAARGHRGRGGLGRGGLRGGAGPGRGGRPHGGCCGGDRLGGKCRSSGRYVLRSHGRCHRLCGVGQRCDRGLCARAGHARHDAVVWVPLRLLPWKQALEEADAGPAFPAVLLPPSPYAAGGVVLTLDEAPLRAGDFGELPQRGVGGVVCVCLDQATDGLLLELWPNRLAAT
mmetsp:Transcript_2140/g.6481  ORF Transcript_2140/g.6481 Transcript_2140/m.6481 type:complete len:235 (-) Transcript_2140:179-883(-)